MAKAKRKGSRPVKYKVDDLPRDRAPDFHGYHAHTALSGVVPSGLRIVFCEIDPTSKSPKPVLLEKCSIVMDADTAQSTGELLIRQAKQWRKNYGKSSEDESREQG